jgi:hypothetical protein
MPAPSKRNPDQEPSSNSTSASGLRPEWKARQARKRMMNIVKAFIGVILLGVVVGLGIVFKDQIAAMFAKKDEVKIAVAPPKEAPPPAAPKVEDKKVTPPPAKVPTPPEVVPPKAVIPEAVPTGEEDAARALIQNGRLALEQFKFKQAATIFIDASKKKAGKLIEEAKSWANKAVQFENAVTHIPVAEYASADTSYIVRTYDGSEMYGLITPESLASKTELTIQRVFPENPMVAGKAFLPIPRSQVKEVVSISRSQRQEEFTRLIDALTSGLTPERSTDYYDVVYVCRRLNMGKRCIDYLDMAYSGANGKQPDKFLGDTFRKHVINRTIERASLMLIAGRPKRLVEDELNKLVKRVLPGYDVARDEVEAFRIEKLNNWRDDFKATIVLKEKKPAAATPSKTEPQATAKELAAAESDQVEIVVENDGLQGKSAKSQTLVEEANKKYEDGMAEYRKFRQGTNGDNNGILKRAMVMLEKAVELYDKVLTLDGGNQMVLDRQTSANMIVYACKKYQTL